MKRVLSVRAIDLTRLTIFNNTLLLAKNPWGSGFILSVSPSLSQEHLELKHINILDPNNMPCSCLPEHSHQSTVGQNLGTQTLSIL